jgi:hypothetical protein
MRATGVASASRRTLKLVAAACLVSPTSLPTLREDEHRDPENDRQQATGLLIESCEDDVSLTTKRRCRKPRRPPPHRLSG